MTQRRRFLGTTALWTAGLTLGGTARAFSRILGANDLLVIAVIGIRGQGNALKRGFARLEGVEIKTLCDVDENLFPSRAQDPTLADLANFRPGYQKDLRRVFDDKDIDAVVVATPNHWHALASIWAMQAGKHVFVEKPCSHNVVEGRRMVEAARKYKRVVQVGTMNRSRPPVQDAIRFLHEGGIGEVYLARGLCYKARPSIGRYPDGPIPAGEVYKLNVEAAEAEPTWDTTYLAKVDYDLWLGPALSRPFNRNRFHYNWHWHWDYGNGDTGNQGPHQFDIARWGLKGAVHPTKVSSSGGLFGAKPGETSQETPDVQTALFEYADGRRLEFSTRGPFTNDEGSQRIGNLFYGTKGWLYVDGAGHDWQSYFGRNNEKGPGSPPAPPPTSSQSDPRVLTSLETVHYQNFVDAVRAGDPAKLTCDIEEGHLSACLPHLANIAYRTGRTLRFDGRTEKLIDDKDANRFLTREYRAPFKVPDHV
jgi:predicted dehydrogenase